ncbi:MAG: putative baseplate assembly protein [Phycisphaerales bacterium]
MALPLPDLDNRRWADLVEEARALIPLYAPEWTDHNIHDPGITLIELFAMIAEMDMYRANRVPDAHVRRFLQLVGVEARPPRGARAGLAVALETGALSIFLPAHTELTANGVTPAPIFQTIEDLTVLPGNLVAVQVWDGRAFTDLTRQWQRGETIAPFGSDPQVGAALYLGFDRDDGWPGDAQLSLQCIPGDAQLDERDRLIEQMRAAKRACTTPDDLVTCCPSGAPAVGDAVAGSDPGPLHHHSARIVWEMCDAASVWSPLPANRVGDDTRAFTLIGRVVLTLPELLPEHQIGQIESELMYVRCRFARGAYDAAPEFAAIHFNGVSVAQTAPVVPLAWRISTNAQVIGTAPAAGQLANFDLELEPRSITVVYEQGLDNATGVIECVLHADAGGTPLSGAPITLSDAGGEIDTRTTGGGGGVRFTLPNTIPRQYTLKVVVFGNEFTHQLNYNPTDAEKLTLKLTLALWIETIDFDAADAPQFRLLDYTSPSSNSAGEITVQAAAVGSGTGRPDQELALPESAVAGSSLRLYSLEESGWRAWAERLDFITSERTDSHFLIDHESARITFGDGERGRVLPAAVPLVADYLVTDGSAGNVPSGTTFEIADTPHNRAAIAELGTDQLPVRSITNTLPAEGGDDGEDLDEATSRALELIEKPQRAVTLEDYELLSRQTPGARLARVTARANLHPSFPCLRASGVITLIIVPFLPASRPMPSRELRRAVAAYLCHRRVLGTRVEVVGPEYIEVSVRARVQACTGVSRTRLAETIRAALDDLFHPLTGGPANTPLPEADQPERSRLSAPVDSASLTGAKERGWPLGRDVYRSEVLQVIDETDGTDHVLALEFVLADGQPTCGNVCIPPNGLVASGLHEIEVV